MTLELYNWNLRKNKFNHSGYRYPSSKWDGQVRRAVHRAGLRYLTQRGIAWGTRARGVTPLVATPDLYFEKYRLAVFLDGCYWHGCQICQPTKNQDRYERDRHVDAALERDGYRLLRIWEHVGAEVAAEQVIERVAQLRAERPSSGRGG
tara:strand:+ start:526 stop:972 length:447 start_codon:yes stop_codon:yes gene_type:complete